MLRKLSFAAAMLAAAAFGVAAASPLAPQSSADTDGSLVTLAKSGKGGGGKNGKGGGGGKGASIITVTAVAAPASSSASAIAQ
jgi:hypothetical protein